MRRRLGNGRWDKVLIKNMVNLSVADDYESAKDEWIATGKCWWTTSGEEMPSWVQIHPNKCLCGHDIIYHFEILNTENGVRECVGSDHINSYLVIRALKEEGLADEQITDEKIEEWINIRIQSMKSNAWWNSYGDEFTKMFDAVKDYDLRVNVRIKGKYYDSKLRMNRDKTYIRKASSGEFGTPTYKMSSIVWRWNHPDNPKNQSTTRGFPNQRLHQDLMMFYFNLEKAKEIIKKEDDFEKKRIETLKKYDEQRKNKTNAEIKRRQLIVSQMREQAEKPQFIEACEYYGVEPFIPEELGKDAWSIKFLHSVKKSMSNSVPLTEKQVEKLWDIDKKKNIVEKATDKQKNYLKRLGFEGDIDELTKSQASIEINKLRNSM